MTDRAKREALFNNSWNRAEKGDALTDKTVKHSFELYQYVAGQNNYVKVDEGDYFYGVTPAFSVTGGNSYYVVIDGVQSNIARA